MIPNSLPIGLTLLTPSELLMNVYVIYSVCTNTGSDTVGYEIELPLNLFSSKQPRLLTVQI